MANSRVTFEESPDNLDSSNPNVFVEKKLFTWERSRNKAVSNKRKKLSKSVRLPAKDEVKTGPSPQQLADELYLGGDIDQAAQYYALALDEQSSIDLNNNPTENSNMHWSISYLDSKLAEVDKKIEVNPETPAFYLEKAAILFFQDKWSEARTLLATALKHCSDKSEIRATIGNLNKLERSLAVGLG